MFEPSVPVRQRLVLLTLFLILIAHVSMRGANVSLAWSPSTSTNIAGYSVYYGTASSNYTASVNAGVNTSVTVSNLTPGQTYYFNVLAYDTNQDVSPFSAQVVDTVPTTAPPTITYGTYSNTVNLGAVCILEVMASGTGPISYQWYFNGVPLSGATNFIYWINAVSGLMAGTYTVVVSNSGGSVTSAPMTLTVISPPAITSQPYSESVTTGANAGLAVVATGGQLAFQWFFNGTAIAGATSAGLSVPNASTANAGNYYVTVTNTAGSVTSSSATLTVTTPPPPAPNFTPLAGAYNGLFYQTNGNSPNVAVGTAGLLGNCVVASNGVYSAQLSIAGSSYSFSGTLNGSGNDSEVVSRLANGLSNLTVNLHLDMTGASQQITGSVSNMDASHPWVSPLLADLATNALPVPAGSFILYIPALVIAPVHSPSGYADVLVSANGSVTLIGMLFDGTTFSQSAAVARDGTIPMYASLYGGRGLIEGWVNLANDQPTGAITWIRPAGVSTPTPYPAGFTNSFKVN